MVVFAHLFQFQARMKSVVQSTTMECINSRTKTPAKIADVYSMAVRRTRWIHNNLSETLQCRVALDR